MTLPTFVTGGTSAGGIGDIVPTVASEQADDMLLLVCETGAEAVSAPAGWTAVPGGIAIASATRLTAFWKLATSGAETDPTVTDPGDHCYGRIFTIRGADTTDPFEAVAVGRRDNDASGVAYTPGVRTSVADCLVFCFWSWSADNAGPLSSLETNASLANLTERSDEGTTAGNGGGFALITGEKAAAGGVDQTACTTGVAVATATMTIAIRPPQTSGGVSRSRVVNA